MIFIVRSLVPAASENGLVNHTITSGDTFLNQVNWGLEIAISHS
ncbi:MAG: hypothetical protein H6Q26_1683 [Bacteroidetes bacterium]|nr:hypothetical protein [Bacteroidota bacterium]